MANFKSYRTQHDYKITNKINIKMIYKIKISNHKGELCLKHEHKSHYNHDSKKKKTKLFNYCNVQISIGTKVKRRYKNSKITIKRI